MFKEVPPISTTSSPTEISEWKAHPAVAKCHKCLFKRVEHDNTDTFMTRIINKVWPVKKKTPKIHIAYTIAVCDFFLDPNVKTIQVSEPLIKEKLSKYLRRVVNKERLSSDNDDNDEEEEGLSERKKKKLKKLKKLKKMAK